MTSFGELIEKAKDGDKDKIIEVMEWTLKKTQKDTIEEQDIKKVIAAANKLQNAKPDNSREVASIASWADKYQTFINNTTNLKGGKRKTKRRRKKKRKTKKTRKKRRRRTRKKRRTKRRRKR
tara:strand:- start:4593 stop:4958 length:366 start_codon:yes stop_codon:yes gene_type:complete